MYPAYYPSVEQMRVQLSRQEDLVLRIRSSMEMWEARLDALPDDTSDHGIVMARVQIGFVILHSFIMLNEREIQLEAMRQHLEQADANPPVPPSTAGPASIPEGVPPALISGLSQIGVSWEKMVRLGALALKLSDHDMERLCKFVDSGEFQASCSDAAPSAASE